MRFPQFVLLLVAGLYFSLHATAAAGGPPDLLIGFTQGRNDLPGGQFENWRTSRAHVIRADGTGDRTVAAELAVEPDVWTGFRGWSPDGRQGIVLSCRESPENAAWERAHKTFRFTEGWLVDSCLVDIATGAVTNLTAIDRVSDYNTGLFFLPDGSGYGFLATIDGNQRPFMMGGDGRSKRPAAKQGAGFAYGYSAAPDGKRISYHENYRIIVSAADGSDRRTIDTGNPFNFSPRWSPDGEWLLFVSGEHHDCHPYVVRRDGTGLQKIADRGGYRGVVETLTHPDFHSESSDLPVWGGDSRSIYYTAKVGESIELMRVTLDGTVEQLTHSKPGVRHYHPAVSPDGGWILFGSDRTGVMQIYVARIDGADAKAVTAAPPGHAAMHGYWQPGVLRIGSRKQLFIDERFVAEKMDVKLVVNPPVKAGPIDVAAETAPCVVEHGGVCHLYQGLNGRTSLWTSTDGLTWKAHGPLAGIDDAGPMWTSINSVFIDPKDAAYPFKGLYERTPKVMVEPATGRNHVAPVPGGLYLCRSRDGITWDYLPQVAIPFTCDTHNQMLYDPWRDRYAAYVRAFPEVSGPWKDKRCVARVETADLLSLPWPHRTNPANKGSGKQDFPYINDELDLVMGPDADDPPMTDLYNPCVHVYPEAEAVYLAFPSMYRCWGYGSNISAGRDHRGTFFNDGLFETQLAVSRDGIHFTRHHTPYLLAGLVRDRSGSEGDIDCGLMMMGIGMLRRGDEIWQYCYAGRRTHEDRAHAEKYG